MSQGPAWELSSVMAKRIAIQSPKLRFTPEERLQDMDAQGVDVQ